MKFMTLVFGFGLHWAFSTSLEQVFIKESKTELTQNESTIGTPQMPDQKFSGRKLQFHIHINKRTS